MSDPVVHITNGIPDSGTGNITTLGQTLTDGANATLGITTGAAVITDAPGTIQQFLRGLVKLLTGNIGVQANEFAVAATTLTRPANTTAYANGNSVSNNQTAGSVTALSAAVSSSNNAPIAVTHLLVDTNDTGIGAGTVFIRVYLYNSDPTANSGVQAGNGATFANKKAGLIGTFTGQFTSMFDGGKAVLTPETGAPYIVCLPSSGGTTLYVQHQIVSGAPTPSANSTTIDTLICGFQGR